jgi:hypothetical protein
MRIGQLSRDLETHPQAKGGRHDTDVAPTKNAQLEQAGIHLRTAEEQDPKIRSESGSQPLFFPRKYHN